MRPTLLLAVLLTLLIIACVLYQRPKEPFTINCAPTVVNAGNETLIKLVSETQANYKLIKSVDRYMLQKISPENTYLTFGNLTTNQKGYFQTNAELAASIYIEQVQGDFTFHLNLAPKPATSATYDETFRLRHQNGDFYRKLETTTNTYARFQAVDSQGNVLNPTFGTITNANNDWRNVYLPYAAIRKIGTTNTCIAYNAGGYYIAKDQPDHDTLVELYPDCQSHLNQWSQWIPQCTADRRCKLHNRMVTDRCLDTEDIPGTNTARLVAKPCNEDQYKWRVGNRNRFSPVNLNWCLLEGTNKQVLVKKEACEATDPRFSINLEQQDDINKPAIWNLTDKCMEGNLEDCPQNAQGKYILPYDEDTCDLYKNSFLHGAQYDYTGTQCLYTSCENDGDCTIEAGNETSVKLVGENSANYTIVKGTDRYRLKRKSDNTYLTFGNIDTSDQQGYFQPDASMAAAVYIEKRDNYSFTLKTDKEGIRSDIGYKDNNFIKAALIISDRAHFQALDEQGNVVDVNFPEIPNANNNWRNQYLPFAAIRKASIDGASTNNCITYNAETYHMNKFDNNPDFENTVNVLDNCPTLDDWSLWIPKCKDTGECRLHSKMVPKRCLDTEEGTNKLVAKPCNEHQYNWKIEPVNRIIRAAPGECLIKDGNELKVKTSGCELYDPRYVLDMQVPSEYGAPALWKLMDKCTEGNLLDCPQNAEGKYILPYDEDTCNLYINEFLEGPRYEFINNQCLYMGILDLIRTQYLYHPSWGDPDQNCKGPWQFTYTFELKNTEEGTLIDSFTTIPMSYFMYQQPRLQILNQEQSLPNGYKIDVYRTGKWPDYKELITTFTDVVPQYLNDNSKTYCQLVQDNENICDSHGTLSFDMGGETYYAYKDIDDTNIHARKRTEINDIALLRLEEFDFGDSARGNYFLVEKGTRRFLYERYERDGLFLFAIPEGDLADGTPFVMQKISGTGETPEKFHLRYLGTFDYYMRVDANKKLIMSRDNTLTKIVYTKFPSTTCP